jgi:hypothetical protein
MRISSNSSNLRFRAEDYLPSIDIHDEAADSYGDRPFDVVFQCLSLPGFLLASISPELPCYLRPTSHNMKRSEKNRLILSNLYAYNKL